MSGNDGASPGMSRVTPGVSEGEKERVKMYMSAWLTIQQWTYKLLNA